MRFGEILRLVWINIMENKAKMMLTSLGIIVGAATIVLVIAVGRGGQADVADQFKNLNAGAIDVSVGDGVDMDAMFAGMGGFPGMPNFSGGMPNFSGGMPSGGMPGGGMSGGGSSGSRSGSRSGGSTRRPGEVELDMEDVEDIKTFVSGIDEVTILESGDTTVYGGVLEEEMEATVVGVLDNYDAVSNLTTLYGRFFEAEDNDETAYVAVIGYSLAEEIFEYAAYAYGDYLAIEGKNYEIIGVLNTMGSVSSGISPDTAVYIPYNTAVKHVFGGEESPTITAIASSVGNVDQAMTDIEAVLTENYPSASFDITDAGSAMEAATSSANTLASLLLAVATIVFIVGGIGIMNVMFVTVQERTGEIGILKAMGFSRRAILMEFVMEAALISVIGGVLGVGLSFALIPVLEWTGTRMENSVWGWVLALVFAVVTGTVFGFYPAWKASRLNPIEALNQE
ncbi:MAG: ABC transporter permease [Eubacteriales bacterium]|nr:ABC transporter permease [Eubacteriales bacterium]